MNETMQLILDNHKDFTAKRDLIDKLFELKIITKEEQSEFLQRVVDSYKKDR